MEGGNDLHYHPIVDLPDGVYKYGGREKQDRSFGFIFGLTGLATISLGIFACVNVNPHYEKLADPTMMKTYSHCSAKTAAEAASYRSTLAADDSVDGATFLHDAKLWLALSLAGAAFVGVVFLALFRSFARQTVWGMIYLKVAALGAVGFYALASGGGSSPTAGVVLLALAAFTAIIFFLWRREIELVARLLAVSAKSLQDNPHIITAVVFLKVCLLCVLVSIGAFIAAAYMNGEVTLNPEATRAKDSGGGGGGDTCVLKKSSDVEGGGRAGDATPCCVWTPEGWASAYIALATMFALWSVMLAFEARLYTVGGVVAQWYFAPPGTANFKGTTLSSLRNAAGPSFGSLCFGSLVLTAVAVARKINRNARRDASRQGGGGLAVLMCLLSSCLDCIYALIEYVSKFATIQCAITGAAFCDAARSVSQLLANNFLSAYGVWWLPGTILSTASFLFSVAYGVVVGLTSYATWNATASSKASHPSAGAEAAVLGVVASVLAMIVLQFCVSVLLNVVDAVFVCYAMDLDRQLSSKPDVHDVFTAVRQKRQEAASGGGGGGAVVEGPGGNIAYGRPAGYRAPALPADGDDQL